MTPTDSRRGPMPVRRGVAGHGLSPAQARVLEHLQGVSGDASVDQVAAALGNHPNTVREHLDLMVGAGLVLRTRVPGPGRGRPAWRYRANPHRLEPDPRVREYGALAGALAAHIAAHSPDPRAEARMAGQRWGRAFIDATPPGSVAAARLRVVTLLAELDFGPNPNAAATRVVLTTCPLLDVAALHTEVVCAVHEGMVAGALDSLTAPSEGVRLTPFGAPNGCVLAMPAATSADETQIEGVR